MGVTKVAAIRLHLTSVARFYKVGHQTSSFIYSGEIRGIKNNTCALDSDSKVGLGHSRLLVSLLLQSSPHVTHVIILIIFLISFLCFFDRRAARW